MRSRARARTSSLDLKKHATKKIYCKKCHSIEITVDENVESALCYICTSNLAPFQKLTPVESGFVRGWKFMKLFVHEDGRVFEFGEENPKLKNKYEPTDVKKIRTSRKKTKKTARQRIEEEEKEMQKLAEHHNKVKQERNKQ